MKKKIVYFCAGVLLTSLILVAIQVAATAPNPGHDSSTLSIGDNSCYWTTVRSGTTYGDEICPTGYYMKGVRRGSAPTGSHTHQYCWGQAASCCPFGMSCNSGANTAGNFNMITALYCCAF